MSEYVSAAVQRGLTEIAFSDHMPMEHPILKPCCMELGELEGYVENVLALKEEWGDRISIKLGIEADYVQGQEEYISKTLSTYPFDVVLGSVHMIDEWAIDHPKYAYRFEEGCVLDIYKSYAAYLEKAVRSGLFDVLAHIDLVKKLNYIPDYDDIPGLFSDILEAAAEMGAVIELSSGGLRKPVQEQYPSAAILEKAIQKGIGIVTGSDAHAPGEVGEGFGLIYGMLDEKRVTSITGFTKRKAYEIPLAVKDNNA
jgi:histidinol-phosphatase (PHP family)